MIDVSNPPQPITNEWIFNTVANHLIRQKRQSLRKTDELNRCAYRSDDGTNCKCAMGVLIPDDKYDPIIEGYSLRMHTNKPTGYFSGLTSGCYPVIALATIFKDLNYSNDNMRFVLELQAIHDNVPVKEWIAALKNLHLEQSSMNWETFYGITSYQRSQA